MLYRKKDYIDIYFTSCCFVISKNIKVDTSIYFSLFSDYLEALVLDDRLPVSITEITHVKEGIPGFKFLPIV